MRKSVVIGSILILAALAKLAAPEAWAQQGGFWNRAAPKPFAFQPVDSSRALRPGDPSRNFRQPSGMRTFSMNSFFPKLNIMPWPPRSPGNVLAPTPKGTGFIQGYNTLELLKPKN